MTIPDLLIEADKFVAGGSIATPVPLRTLVKGLTTEVRFLRLGAGDLASAEAHHDTMRQMIADRDAKLIEAGVENARLSALVESLGERCHGQHEVIAARAETDVSEAVEAATMLTVIAERDHLARFKQFVHTYLDGKNIPHHPPGIHGAEGCRIGDRMDFVFAEIERLRAAKGGDPDEVDRLRETVTRLNRRTQEAERAMADLLRCNEKLASGAAWCSGSLGRGFLAYENSRLRADKARLLALIEGCRGRCASPDVNEKRPVT